MYYDYKDFESIGLIKLSSLRQKRVRGKRTLSDLTPTRMRSCTAGSRSAWYSLKRYMISPKASQTPTCIRFSSIHLLLNFRLCGKLTPTTGVWSANPVRNESTLLRMENLLSKN